jgi:hypothetical protein
MRFHIGFPFSSKPLNPRPLALQTISAKIHAVDPKSRKFTFLVIIAKTKQKDMN